MFDKAITLMLLGRDEEQGATATEYALLGAFIAVVIATSVGFFGRAVAAVFMNFPDIWP